MKTRSFKVAALLLPLSLAAALTGCDAPSSDAPCQVVEPQIGHALAMEMLELVDLDEDQDVADYHIYAPEPEGLDLTAPGCGMPEPGPYDTDCGVCVCLGSAGIVCIDYQCGAGTGPEPDVDQASDAFTPGPARCEGGELVGHDWMVECNVCTCLPDGTTVCTIVGCQQP